LTNLQVLVLVMLVYGSLWEGARWEVGYLGIKEI
jgi:hypothetical protein